MRFALKIAAYNVVACSIVAGLILGGWTLFFKHEPTPQQRINIFRFDERFGFAMTPLSIGVDSNYHVTYTVDAAGCRVTPDPAQPKGRVIILGCSFTFGECVNDDQAYPYILGRDYWPRHKVINRACMAYGTGQAWLAVEDELKQRPALVIYGFMSGHVIRNYLDKSWLTGLTAFETPETGKRRNPWFEIENGKPVYKGIVGPEKAMEQSGEQWEKTKTITVALIVDMYVRCREAGVPFFCVNVPTEGWRTDDIGPGILARVRAEHVPCLDLQGTDREFHPNAHPKPSWHVAVAEALGKHPEIRQALGY